MAVNIAQLISVSTSFIALCVGFTSGFSFCYVFLYLNQWENLILMAGHGGHNDYPVSNTFEQGVTYDQNEAAKKDVNVVAQLLERQIRVLCMVMTSHKKNKTNAIHIKATWGKRCNVLIFISSVADHKLPSIVLKTPDGNKFILAKTKEAFRYVYKHHIKEADWFLKVDDSSYVILENLRHLLATYNASRPVYFGCRLKSLEKQRGKPGKQGYMSVDAGYVLSKEAMRRFVTRAIPNKRMCSQYGPEDKEMGKCLANVGVIAGDSRDELGRGRFFPFSPRQHLIPGGFAKNLWYLNSLYYPSKEVEEKSGISL